MNPSHAAGFLTVEPALLCVCGQSLPGLHHPFLTHTLLYSPANRAAFTYLDSSLKSNNWQVTDFVCLYFELDNV